MKIKILLSTLILCAQTFAGEAAFYVKLVPGGSFVGRTTKFTGFSKITGNKITAENIKFDLSELHTGMELRDKHTKKYLEVEHFPEAILVKATGENGKGTGLIKIKGIEKPIEGTYSVSGTEMIAEFILKLSDFKITGIRYMGVGVGDEVRLTVKVPVKK
jgi:polyisoprenoid-binding protein YceI